MGLSTIDNLRKSLDDFSSDGKFILAYEETFSLGAFYLNSVADKVYLYPEGMIDFRGLAQSYVFQKSFREIGCRCSSNKRKGK